MEIEGEKTVVRCTTSNTTDDAALDSMCEDEELGSTITELVSFIGSEHLLRAIPLAKLMDGLGRIFSTSRGTDATYQLSKKVVRIGYFVSHNWTIHRVVKFIALAFKFNMKLVLGAILGTFLICFSLGVAGAMPHFETAEYDKPVSITCRLVIIPIVLGTLFFGRSVLRFRDYRKTSVFLDKACIHQMDPALQAQGIRKLGAFLRMSDRMLVLYSSVYLKKLWTVYEVASFLAMHDMSQLELVPVMLPCAFLLVLCGHFGFQSLHVAVRVAGLPAWVAVVVNYVGATTFYASLRIWSKSKAQIKEHLRSFDVAAAKCAVEDDREVVYTNIVALMKAAKKVKRNATRQQTLEAFNLMVRAHLASQFDKLFGRFAFCHSEYLVLSLTVLAPYYVDSWSLLSQGAPFREVLGQRSLDLFWVFSGITIWHLVMEVVGRCFLHLEGWKDIAYIFASNFIVSGLGGNLFLLLSDEIAKLAETSDILLVVLLVVQALTTAAAFRYVPRVASLHRSNTASLSTVDSPDEAFPDETTRSNTKTNRQSNSSWPTDLEAGAIQSPAPASEDAVVVLVSDLDQERLEVGGSCQTATAAAQPTGLEAKSARVRDEMLETHACVIAAI